MENDTKEKHSLEKYSYCSETFVAFSLSSSAEGIHLYRNIAVITINLALSILGILANVLVVAAYAVNKRLRTSPNMLLVVLAVSDLMVTAVVQPLYVARKLQEIIGTHNCQLGAVMGVTGFFCCGVSLATVFILSIERFIILAFPYRHQNIINPTRLKATVVLLWLLALMFSVSQLGLISSSAFSCVVALIVILSVSTVVLIWVWIHRVIRQHKIRIENLRTPSDVINKGTHSQGVLETTRTSYLIVAAVLFCYFPIPMLMLFVTFKENSFSSISLVKPWVNTIVCANSSLNPLLLFWRKKAFRETAKKALSKVIGRKATVNPTL